MLQKKDEVMFTKVEQIHADIKLKEQMQRAYVKKCETMLKQQATLVGVMRASRKNRVTDM